MQNVKAGETCYYTILHVDGFTPDVKNVLKNGAVDTTIGVTVNSTYNYLEIFTFSFIHNGIAGDIFEIKISDTSTGERYSAKFKVAGDTSLQVKQIQYIRNRLTSDGGVFGNNDDNI